MERHITNLNKPITNTFPPMANTLIANSGIQLIPTKVDIDLNDRHKVWFHEWYDETDQVWKLELMHELHDEDTVAYYRKDELAKGGYLVGEVPPTMAELAADGIRPLQVDDTLSDGVVGEIFAMTIADRGGYLDAMADQWMPLPFFYKWSERRFAFGPLNWSRFKMVPRERDSSLTIRSYDLVLAFDTFTDYTTALPDRNESPVFVSNFTTQQTYGLCTNMVSLLDYCAPNEPWSYVNQRLLEVAHPGLVRPDQIRGKGQRKTGYIAAYIVLMDYLVRHRSLEPVVLYKDRDVEVRDVDMVIDIGNSRTTALLVEDTMSSFNQVRSLSLTDYTTLVERDARGNPHLSRSDEPFDMRLAFRRVDFGNFGPRDSRRFVYPSLVRLGREASLLVHRTETWNTRTDTLSTYSSPKRYLWDKWPSAHEWEFMVLPGEEDRHIIDIPAVTRQLRSDGTFDPDGAGGLSYHYSRRSLMTLAFLEMLVQAREQINSIAHRSVRLGVGHENLGRKIKRLVVTCPTSMSRVEREALVRCARDAVRILARINAGDGDINPADLAQVVPSPAKFDPSDPDAAQWYYDEATCAQLVYMYGEVGHKYKGCCEEFFELYGKQLPGEDRPGLTVGSLDIGAGTTDLMISRYSYTPGDVTTITPSPLFYDSYYFAGDDMLHGLIKNIMLLSEDSAFRLSLATTPTPRYRQLMKNFFGPDHNEQTLGDRILRRDFNIQYSVPLMYHMLEMVKNGAPNGPVSYADVFADCPVNPTVIEGFRDKTGIDITDVVWHFDNARVSQVIEKELEPLLKKIATIMYAHGCDIVLLSGRPASLPPVRDIFLKYYAVAPNRLILLNNYYVGDWYPFDNNTGCIANPKTIVAMGGIIGHYASEYSAMDKFVIDLEKLRSGLRSTVNYISANRTANDPQDVLTPDTHVGELTLSTLPADLSVRQLQMASYPRRELYTIDFNRHKIADRIRRRAITDAAPMPSDAKVKALVQDAVADMRRRMPFKVVLERDPDDKETIKLASIMDKDGKDLADSNIEINIRSLGTDGAYWLDSGEFAF